ncbi:MAG: T9SS type A sorting domain-containing protein [Bacteroidia bacterium]|nr:T9SS type A sorting domain-containing protein [Bacteroidia bacterium]
MKKKANFLFAMLLVLAISSFAQVIPSDRLITWQGNVGVEGGIPTRTVLVNCTLPPFNAHANGINTASEIQACLNSLSSGQVCYLPPGVYSLSSQLNIPSNVTLRGAGADSTTLLFTTQLSNDVNIGGNYTDAGNGGQINMMSGYTKGSNQLVLQNASTLSAGKFIYLTELNDPSIPVNVTNTNGTCSWCGLYGSGGSRARIQLTKVTAVNGNTVTINPAMYFNFSASNSPQVFKAPTYVQYAGVESLTIKNSGTTMTSTRRNLNLQGAANCWARYVKFENVGRRGVNLWFDVFRNEIRDCYFVKCLDQQNNDNYALEINSGSANLVENNVFDNLGNGTLLVSSSGNVFGYNFIKAVHRTSQLTTWFWPDSWTHGGHSSYNLWEGNDQTALEFDFYWGSNSHDMAFRNRFHGKDASINYNLSALMTNGAILTYPQNNYMSAVGNVLGEPGFATKYEETTYQATSRSIWCTPTAAFGFTTNLAFTSMFRHLNFDYFTSSIKKCGTSGEPGCQAASGSTVIPSSLYLPSKPSWFCNITYPPIGPDVIGGQDASGHTFKNPAQVCYDNTPTDINGNKIWNGKNCSCNNVVTDIKNKNLEDFHLSLFPNPTSGSFQVNFDLGIHSLYVFNNLGQQVFSKNVNNETSHTLELSENGVYFVVIEAENKQTFSKKVFVCK